MKAIYLPLFIFTPLVFHSCVSTGTFKAVQQQSATYDSLYRKSQSDLKVCRDSAADLMQQKVVLFGQLDDVKKQEAEALANNKQLLAQIRDLSVISSSQAQSIQKSIDNISSKDQYIQDIRGALASRDSANLALVMALRNTTGNLSDRDFQVNIEKGNLTITISDKLLFNGTGFDLTPGSNDILSKVASALQTQPDLQFLVEGNTDSTQFQQGVLLDNWDLSVKRATSIVRVLQNQYNITPMRMTAAGRAEFNPATFNSTPDAMAANRRTRIIVLPQMDRLLRILERKG